MIPLRAMFKLIRYYYHILRLLLQSVKIISTKEGSVGVLHKKIATWGLLIAFCSGANVAAESNNDSHWWDSFSITPGIGFRHLGVDITRKSDSFHGNISNAGFAQIVFTLNMVFNEFQLDDDGRVYLELNSYTSLIDLDHQFYDYGTGGSTNYGERVDVGTELSGYYTYLMPSIKYALKLSGGGEMSASFGLGFWNSSFDGDIILTSDGRPVSGMPTTNVSLSTTDQLAYLVNLKWETRGGWVYLMSVGGTAFSDDDYDYELEEVSMIVGKVIYF